MVSLKRAETIDTGRITNKIMDRYSLLFLMTCFLFDHLGFCQVCSIFNQLYIIQLGFQDGLRLIIGLKVGQEIEQT